VATLATQPWVQGYASTSALSAQHQGTHMEMLQKIRQPCAFATWRPGPTAAPVAWALAVRDGRHVGIFDVVVSPQHRRQGHGRALMQALLQWAQGDGATSAYLQVTGSNAAARSLYASLGFEPAYAYHYRLSQPPASA
jgi:ribosomal protein S18 acetylase RimI-like enzyme